MFIFINQLYINLSQTLGEKHSQNKLSSKTIKNMAPTLEITNFKVQQPSRQFVQVLKNLIFMRKHKQITIEKPMLDFNANDSEWYHPDKLKNSHYFFKTEQEEKEQKLRNNKVLLKRDLKTQQVYHSQSQSLSKSLEKSQKSSQILQPQIDHLQSPIKVKIPFTLLKRKLIKKAISSSVNKEKQKQVQKKYCKYLLNSLHKSNLLLIHHGVPPNLSVLETIDDGDYLKEDQRKDFPHYSNVLQPIDLPPVMQQKVQIIRQPVRFDPRQHAFSVEENSIFKVKHIYLLIEKLFEQSIKTCEKIREMNFRGDHSLRPQNENHNFQQLAQMLGVSYRVAKLLYDMLNDHYDLEKEMAIGRSDDYKVRLCKELIELAQKQVQEFFQKRKNTQEQLAYSCYTPLEEYYLSLKDLRDIFIEVHYNQK